MFNAYPFLHVDDLVDLLGKVRFISTLDLTKGYWEVALTTFTSDQAHWQYWVLPFSLHAAPATFQQLMDIVHCNHLPYAAAYLDDVMIHFSSWEDHLHHLKQALGEL